MTDKGSILIYPDVLQLIGEKVTDKQTMWSLCKSSSAAYHHCKPTYIKNFGYQMIFIIIGVREDNVVLEFVFDTEKYYDIVSMKLDQDDETGIIYVAEIDGFDYITPTFMQDNSTGMKIIDVKAFNRKYISSDVCQWDDIACDYKSVFGLLQYIFKDFPGVDVYCEFYIKLAFDKLRSFQE